MNIEDLSKTQLLLLTILVNFITAIATAVMTVSLLDQAPPTITQTVNRIVERTVETASQTPLPAIPGITPPAKETIIIRDEDLLAAAIRADAGRRVLIHRGDADSQVIAYGTYLPDTRAVVTATAQNLPKEATIVFADGTVAEASLSRGGASLTIYGFSDTETLPAATTPDLIAPDALNQGQTLVALTREGAAVSGIISLVEEAGIRTNVTGVPPGAAAVNIQGDVIGIATAVAGVFAPASRITFLLEEEP